MKPVATFVACVAVAAFAWIGPSEVKAQDVKSATGTITAVSPGVISVSARQGGPAGRFAYNASTTYVDEAGSAVAIEAIAPGAPVTVQYVTNDGAQVATRVILLAGGRTPGTTSENPIVDPTTRPGVSTVETAMGRVTAVTPNEVMVRTETNTRPETYAFTSATEIVDETGARKRLDSITPDSTVTVDFVRDGDRFVARRVVLRTLTPPPASR